MFKLAFLTAASVVALSGSVMAADLAVPAHAAPISAPAATNWDGPYIGATLGYGWSHVVVGSPGSGEGDGTGFLVGGQVGYNFHLSDAIVAGIQGNIDWNNVTGSGGSVSNAHANWDGAIVGRLGYDVNGILPYVEAGVAFENLTATIGATDYSNTHTGWTVGGGVEFMLADQLSANVEYRYSDYGSQNYGPINAPATLTESQFRVGLNYHF